MVSVWWRRTGFGARALSLVLASLAPLALALAVTVEAAPKNRHGIAVIIGNKNYGAKIPAVDFALNDADAMRGYVLDVLGFREGNIIDLRDATKARLEAAFGTKENHQGRLFNWVRAGKSDVVVFYSGHGVPGLKDKRGYLLPVDGDADLAEITGYSVDLLYRNLRKLPARSVTVFLDACFSGDTPKGMLVRALSGISVIYNPAAVEGLAVLTAAQGDQVASWDEDAKHGLFTEHLLRALYGAADGADWGDGDGTVTLAEVRAYLEDEMAYQARRRYNREQTPSVQGQKDRVLARLGKGSRPERRRAGPQVAAVPTRPKPEVSLEPVEAAYVAIKNANVRAEPTVSSAKVTRLATGTEVYVPGKTADGKWLRVERDGKGLGYIYAPLLQEKEAWEAAKREVALQGQANDDPRGAGAAGTGPGRARLPGRRGEPPLGRRHHLRADPSQLPLSRHRAGCFQPARGGLGDGDAPEGRVGTGGPGHGAGAASARRCHPSLRPGLAVHLHRLRPALRGDGRPPVDGLRRRCLRQRHGRELLRHIGVRVDRPPALPRSR